MAKPIPQVVLFGDSLFQGAPEVKEGFSFQGALQARCVRRLDVVNRGLSGYNTSQALKALEEIFTGPTHGGPKLKFLFVLLGANDASVPLPTNDQHVPLEEFKENLTKIIEHPLITAHVPKIFLVTPPPLDEIRITELDLASGHPAATRQAKVSASYSETVRKVAAAHAGVGLVDLWKGIMDYAIEKTPGFKLKGPEGPFLGDPESGERGHLEHLLPDGLHMSGESYKIFFDLVKDIVSQEWASAPEEDHVGYVLPSWRSAPKLEV